MGQLKSAVYARMEEMSFRSGAAVGGGVLTAAGVAITLAVVLGGHSDAVAIASASRAAVSSVAPPSPARLLLAFLAFLAVLAAGYPAGSPDDGPRDSGRGLPAAVPGSGVGDPARRGDTGARPHCLAASVESALAARGRALPTTARLVGPAEAAKGVALGLVMAAAGHGEDLGDRSALAGA